MNHEYLLKNQHGAYLEKSGGWIESTTAKTLFRTPFKDEAVNQKVEIIVKNPDQRIEIVQLDQPMPVVASEPNAQPSDLPEAPQDASVTDIDFKDAAITTPPAVQQQLTEI